MLRLGEILGGSATFEVVDCDMLMLNRLRMYCVRDVCTDDNQLRFTVPLRFVAQVKTILARYRYSVKINKNFFALLNVFYSRIALCVALVVCTVAFFVLNGFVFSVKVIGVEGERASEIHAFVHARGARPLTHKRVQRKSKIAGEIIQSFDYVAHASSKIVGNTLVFNVYDISTPVGVTQNRDIVATVDGVVTGVFVASGRALVSVGDAVKAGQVLIKGERQVGAIDIGRDEFGKLIQEPIFAPCRAVGEIMADVKYSEFGVNTNADELLAKIILRTGIQEFDRVETFSAGTGMLEVVATVRKSIV
jgi:biotin carboxyl carrier protein